MNRISNIFLLFSLVISSLVLASDALLSFEEMDRDANGYISRSEAQATDEIKEHFMRIDTNNDGKINITEFQAFMGKERMTPPEEMETPEPGAAPY